MHVRAGAWCFLPHKLPGLLTYLLTYLLRSFIAYLTMSTNPSKELAIKLRERSRELVQHVFKGAGKFIGGNRFTIGNLEGEEGDSLFIYLDSGRYKDTATDQNGDMLQLLKDKYGDKEGYDVAYNFLGIQKPVKNFRSNGSSLKLYNGQEKQVKSKQQKEWKEPKQYWSQLPLTEDNCPDVFKYLTEERKLTPEVLATVSTSKEIAHYEDQYYLFPLYTHLGENEKEERRKNCGCVCISLEREEKKDRNGKPVRDDNGNIILKKIVKQSTKPLLTLWGHLTCDTTVKNKRGSNQGNYLIITAGQIDCLSLRCHGIFNCVSIPSGEADYSWIENSWDWIGDNFREIYLLFDNDETGIDYTEKVASRLGIERCRKCYLPEEYKDVNEAHVAGFDLTECIKKAKDFDMDKLVPASSMIEETIKVLSLGRRENIGIPFMGWEGEDSVKFRIRPKELTIITGFPNHGKSNGLYQFVAYLIFKCGQKIVLASLEEDPEVINGLVAIHALGFIYDKDDPNKCKAFRAALEVIGEHLFIFSHRGTAKYKELLDTFKMAILKYNIDHAIIDSVAKTDLNIEDNEKARIFVSAVSECVDQTGAHYWLVAHCTKGDDKDYHAIPGMQQVKGDNQFGIQAFNVITIWKNTYKKHAEDRIAANRGGSYKQYTKGGEQREVTAEEVRNMSNSVLYVSKQKVGGQVGKFNLYYDETNYRLHRRPDFSDHPYYADEIIERYITNPDLYADDGSLALKAEEEVPLTGEYDDESPY